MPSIPRTFKRKTPLRIEDDLVGTDFRDLNIPARSNFIKCQGEDFNKNNKAVFIISIGNEKQNGVKLKSMIDLINNTFKYCDIVVCDTLQRHNMKDTFSSDKEFEQQSLNLGNNWIERNREALALLKIPHINYRWNDFLKRNDFEENRKKVLDAYNSDENFRTAFQNTANQFIKRNPTQRSYECIKYSIDYLIEECAIMMLMWQNKKYNYILYSGSEPECFSETHKRFVAPNFKGETILKWIEIYTRSKDIKKTLVEKIQNLNLTLDQLLTYLPGHIYWMDKDNLFMGCNNEQAFNAGLNSRDEIVGKANYQMPWKEYAKELNAINSEVIKTGTPKYLVEKIKLANGEIKEYLSNKIPLRDINNDIYGTLGVSLDIEELKKKQLYSSGSSSSSSSNKKQDRIKSLVDESINLEEKILESNDLEKIKTLAKYLDEKLQRIKNLIDFDT